MQLRERVCQCVWDKTMKVQRFCQTRKFYIDILLIPQLAAYEQSTTLASNLGQLGSKFK